MTRMIKIGTNINGNPTYFVDHGWGVTQVWAKPRYGKSSMAKTLIVRLADQRPLIAFDFYGDWKGMGKFNWDVTNPNINPNYEYTNPERIDSLIVLNNPSFQISDFQYATDWLSWGFPKEGAKAIAELASHEELHHDDVDRFDELLRALPTNDQESRYFKTQYPGTKINHIFTASKLSILTHWQYLRDFFLEPRSVKHWGEFLRKHNQVVVNYNLMNDPHLGIYKARAFTGKILSQLKEEIPGTGISYLEELHPFIILEEADKLLPPLPIDDESSVFNEVIELGLKLQRTGTALLLVTQDPDRLDRDIARMYHTKIMGKVPPGTPDQKLTEKLQWDPTKNYRQFVMLNENGNWEVFVPDFCPCK